MSSACGGPLASLAVDQFGQIPVADPKFPREKAQRIPFELEKKTEVERIGDRPSSSNARLNCAALANIISIQIFSPRGFLLHIREIPLYPKETNGRLE